MKKICLVEAEKKIPTVLAFAFKLIPAYTLIEVILGCLSGGAIYMIDLLNRYQLYIGININIKSIDQKMGQ